MKYTKRIVCSGTQRQNCSMQANWPRKNKQKWLEKITYAETKGTRGKKSAPTQDRTTDLAVSVWQQHMIL